MYRSSSTNQESIYSSAPTALRAFSTAAQDQDVDEVLPVSVLDPAMKEKINRGKLISGEKSVHIIPVVLLICAIILWVFSNPAVVNLEGDATGNVSNNSSKLKGMGIDADHDSDATEHLPLDRAKLVISDQRRKPKFSQNRIRLK